MKRKLNRFGARLWTRGAGGFDAARRTETSPVEIVVYLPLSETQEPEKVAAALNAAFPVGRSVRGVDLLTGALEMRFFYDALLLTRLRLWLEEHVALYEISFFY